MPSLEQISNLGVPVLDILVTAVILYVLYMFIRGTKAINMVLGVVLVFSLGLLARIANLTALNWIFSRFVDNFFIVLVILFSPELRRMLLKFGRNEWVKFFRGEEKEIYRALDTVVRQLAKERVGALFVLQRFSGMQSVQETGVGLYAHVSRELLRAIYWGENPLHDGAVLIKNNVLLAAGCLLPLSDSTTLSHVYGTRHRAALGASEEFDCVVIVVSAERGTVSVAFDGTLKRLPLDEVIPTIIKLMKIRPSRRDQGGEILQTAAKGKAPPSGKKAGEGRPAEKSGPQKGGKKQTASKSATRKSDDRKTGDGGAGADTPKPGKPGKSK